MDNIGHGTWLLIGASRHRDQQAQFVSDLRGPTQDEEAILWSNVSHRDLPPHHQSTVCRGTDRYSFDHKEEHTYEEVTKPLRELLVKDENFHWTTRRHTSASST